MENMKMLNEAQQLRSTMNLLETIQIDTSIAGGEPNPEDYGVWEFEDHNGVKSFFPNMSFNEASREARKAFKKGNKSNFGTMYLIGKHTEY